jgi:hypothetical protein
LRETKQTTGCCTSGRTVTSDESLSSENGDGDGLLGGVVCSDPLSCSQGTTHSLQ